MPKSQIELRVTPFALSVAETAVALRLSEPTIWGEVRSGRLRVRQVGRRVLVPVTAIDEWLNLSKEGQNAAAAR